MPEPRPVLSRRGMLVAGGALGLVGLGACAAEEPDASRSPVSSPQTPPAPRATPSLAPDVRLATAALAEIRVVREAVDSTRERFPALGRALGDVTAMHRNHEDALVDAVPAEVSSTDITPAPYAVPNRRPLALSRLRALEEGLRGRLTELALEAQSGTFAGLLGSMSAGVAQRVVSWPT